MEIKDLVALTLFFVATLACVGATCVSQRARDAAFFLMITGAAVAYKVDVNFCSQFWYRGTTRGFEFSLMDVLAAGVLASSFLFPRRGERRWFWPASLGLMLLFFAYACGNVVFSEPKIYGLFELSKIARGIIFFLAAAIFVRSERELAVLVAALSCAVCFEGAMAVKQRLLGGTYRVTGTLDDANSFSVYLCTVAPVLVAAATSSLPKWLRWLSAAGIAAATVSIVLTLSRAGLPIFGLVMLGATMCCVSWRLTPKKIAATALVVLAIGALLGKQLYLIQARWAQSSLETEYEDPTKFESRGYYLRLAKAIMGDRFWGVGLNNWSYWVSKKYGAQLGTPYVDYDDLTYVPSKDLLWAINFAAPAHSLGALTVGELGVPGLLIFGLVWLRWFQLGARFFWPRVSDTTRRLGVGIFFGTCGLFLQSLTEWVFRQEHIFITFHIMVGTLAALCWLKKQSVRQRRLEARARAEEEQWQYEPVVA